VSSVRLGIRANLPQFVYLLAISALVGGTVGQERAIVPLLATRVFGLSSVTAAVSFVAAYGLAKAVTDLAGAAASERFGRRAVMLVGWALGVVGGVALGIAIGLSTVARSIGIPGVNALFPIPKIAIMPILILWLGIGEASKVATIALGVFFPMAVSTFGAIDNVPRNLVRMAQSFGTPFLDIVRKVLLPGALPGILSGLRISASIALLLVVAAEMIGAERGIGAFVMQAGNLMQTDRLLAGVVVLSVLGLLVGTVLTRLERLLLRWR
jgi:ABC-type nitrate/sulfonate/bicarbonate transport system permease component